MKKLKFVNGQMFEYEILKLVDFYDPILRQPTHWVDVTDKNVAYAALSLMETLNKLNGLGLSANQVGLPYRMFALNVGKQIWCLVNPVIVRVSETKTKFQEGCLSYPGLYVTVGRPDSVVLQYDIVGGERKQQEFNGLTATCVLHEMDHLDGVVYTDRVPKVKLMEAKRKIKTNLKKMKKLAAA
jgi:peptide deformylase